MKIGVFDSGVGGKSIANAISRAMPEHEIVYVHDRQNIPYGNKTPEQLIAIVTPILERMQQQGCNIVVVACNTVSTTIINDLRTVTNIPLVEVEPMVKTAASMTKSKTIAVCATPTTLASKRYAQLKDRYAEGITVIEPDCSEWSSMIEADELDRDQIEASIRTVCRQGADVIVLGCTHYHWIQEEIEETAAEFSGVSVIQPEEPIIARLRKVLSQLQ
jgi:glutamate racemase